MTVRPASRAGRMTLATSSAREEERRNAMASGVASEAVWLSQRERTPSPSRVPPGSRVSVTAYPRVSRAAPRSRACVDFPLPSAPSNVMNRAISDEVVVLPGEELDAPIRLLTPAAGADVVALRELMLEAPNVRVLRCELYGAGALDYFRDRVLRLL